MRVVPWLWTCSSMAARAPAPRAIMVMTEATPMITPSMVRAERTLLRRRARRGRGGRSGPPPRVGAAGDGGLGEDASVAHQDHARRVLRDVVLVGDEDDREPPLPVEPLQDLHDLEAGPAVEVARGVVGEDHLRLVDG